LYRDNRESEEWRQEEPTEIDHKAMRKGALIFSAGKDQLHHEEDCSEDKEPWSPNSGEPLPGECAESRH
jgi:hypothetical protein